MSLEVPLLVQYDCMNTLINALALPAVYLIIRFYCYYYCFTVH